ncbi:histone acetyltransferase [Leifsonia sp. ku-ls]|nr:histone acetyltransferase [Leifsonia sp. ku-ls]
MTDFRSPRPLKVGDIASEFDCGVPALDRWLRAWARRNEGSGASRTFVSVDADTQRVAGYYCLSASSLIRDGIPEALGREMPNPVPVALLGRLAVDRRYSGEGLGRSLLQDALARAVSAAQSVGMVAIIVNAKDESVVPFYERFGFSLLPDGSTHTLYRRVSDIVQSAAAL